MRGLNGRVTNPVLGSLPDYHLTLLTESSYSTSLLKAEKDASFMLDSYLKEPTPENLHGLRTSTRRMLTIFKLLPAKVRDGKPEKRMESFTKLLDLTQKARHFDIVLSKIGSDQNKATEALVKALKKSRDSSLRAAQSIASSLKGTALDKVRINVSDSTVQKRFDKSEEKLTERIQEALPAVKKGSIKRKQLQELRQDGRKLRYLLELSASPEKSERLAVLRTWQELLAAIHDNDACIELLQDGKKTPQVSGLVKELTAERSQNFEKFKSIVEEKGLPEGLKQETLSLAA